MTMYKAIGFDWGGVLNGKPGKFFGEAVANEIGVTPEQYGVAYFHHNMKFNSGAIDSQELWTLVVEELGHPNEPGLVQRILEISTAANADNLNEDVLSLVDLLRRNGYKVGLITNNSADKAALMRKTGLDAHFDAFDVSVETGLVKPDPAAFNYLADELGVKVSELIFIDDTPQSLSTSKETGFTPILFDSYEQLVNDLATLGIHVTA
jgi:epoxide hydrolase-like predicted phosphatase